MTDIKYIDIDQHLNRIWFKRFKSLPLVLFEYTTSDYRILNMSVPDLFLYQLVTSNNKKLRSKCKLVVGFIESDTKILTWCELIIENMLPTYKFKRLINRDAFICFEKLTIQIFIIIHIFDQHMLPDISKYIKKLYIELIK